MYSRRSPPSFATNLLGPPDTSFFKATQGDPPHIHMVEASDRDALRLSEIFESGAEREVFGPLGWDSTLLQETPWVRPWTLRPGVLASWNAVADGEDAFVYLQTWRQHDISQVEQHVWTHRSGASDQDGRSAPLTPGLSSYIAGMIDLAWTKNPIRSGEEAQIVRLKKTKRRRAYNFAPTAPREM